MKLFYDVNFNWNGQSVWVYEAMCIVMAYGLLLKLIMVTKAYFH